MNNKNIIYGVRPVIEAIKSGKEIDKLLIQKGLHGERIKELLRLVRELDAPVQYVPIEKLNRVIRKNHQGVVCFISAVTYQKIENILPTLYEEGKVPFLLILDRITDVRNIGAIARTAECAGVHAIIIPSKGAAQIGPDAYKTSAGAISKIPICRHPNLKDTIDFIKDSGIRVFSASEKATDYYYNTDLNGPVAIIIGSEEDGVSPEYQKRSDKIFRIPILGEIESLNVSVAAGVIIYEVVRQRKG